MNNFAIVSVIAVLEEAKAESLSHLTDPRYKSLSLFLEGNFKTMINRLKVMTGNNLGSATSQTFAPITDFLGDKVHVSKAVLEEDINPIEEDIKKFRADVQGLYDTILSYSTELILKSHTLPEHTMILRGVAKLAGVEDYQTKEIGEAFIDEIKRAINQQLKRKQQEEDFNQNLPDNKTETPVKEIPPADIPVEKEGNEEKVPAPADLDQKETPSGPEISIEKAVANQIPDPAKTNKKKAEK
jgi:hypothetical protein